MQQQTFDFEANERAAIEEKKGPELVRPDRQITFPDAVTHYDWGEPEHDRDTITVDRVVDSAEYGPAHRFVIKRGDTVRAFFSQQRQEVGTVTGVSHARNEVRVSHSQGNDGIWHSIGSIYPAKEREKKAPGTVPLSSAIAAVNDANTLAGGFTDADRVPETTPYSFAEFKELWKTRGKDRSFEQYQETFERIVASEEAIKAELAASFKAPQLKAISSNLGDWNATSNTKSQNTESIYRRMLSFFLLDGTVSFSMGESWEDAVKEKVRAVTEKSYREHHEKLQADALEREQALSAPQTLADFAKFVRVKSADALTNEQMARWDSQHADLARERSAEGGPAKVVTQFESAELAEVQFSIKEGCHDRKECPLWIVQLGSRVEKDAFRELKTKAKMFGGWWSSFKKADAGFQFYSEDDATRFTELFSGDADREDILERRKERKEQSAAERLHELADTLIARAEETIENSNNSLQNTARRADMQAGIRGRAFADQALARTLHSVATALSEGDATYLDGIRHKTHLETLETVLHLSKWARIRAIRKAEVENEYGYGMRVQDEEEKSYSEDDIRFAQYPFPTIWKSHLQDAVIRCKSLRGAKQVAERMRKRIGRSADEMVSFETETDVEFLADFLGRAKAAGLDTQWMDACLEKYKRLQAANITELHTLRSALRELLPHRAEVRADDPVKVAERELIGKELPGFFPTPPAVISLMLEHADIQPHHSVLEPSAGKGDIVAAINLEQPDAQVTAIEMNRTLSDVLAAKNIDVEFSDFLSHNGKLYDRICMNPPFERGNNSDIDHVRHAYSLLADNGRLVSVMGSGALQRSDAKSEQFRSWLDELGAEVIDLPDGAFDGSDAFRQTRVSTKLVVIDLPI